MSDPIIPKERLTAYQRWELPELDAGKAAGGFQRVSPSSLPTAAQLEQMQQQARDEGYAEGMQAAAADVQRIARLADSLSNELQKVDQQISQDLLNLALEIAKQMVHEALAVNPELLLNVVRDAIASLPHFNQGAHLILHPADAELLRGLMGERLGHSGWKVFDDAKMERGGFRVETAHSQIDATLAARWQNIVASIGQTHAWLKS